MSGFSFDEVKRLVGDTVPAKGSVPAVWWITTNAAQIAAFDQWRKDFDAHLEKVEALASTIDSKATDAFMFSWGTTSEITGFRVPIYMDYWKRDHPEYRPVPDGWRIDKKKDRLVPSRKTKADRESQVNKDFAAIKRVPNVKAYVSGLPTEIHLDDRDFGGTMYAVNFRRGAGCVWAYSGGDPDRQPEKRMNEAVDESIWQRQKLSTLIALREGQS
jgi:hypothetical protein